MGVISSPKLRYGTGNDPGHNLYKIRFVVLIIFIPLSKDRSRSQDSLYRNEADLLTVTQQVATG